MTATLLDTDPAHPIDPGYGRPDSPFDEMVTGQGRMRPHWKLFLSSLGALHADRMAERWENARRLLRQNGVTYNVYGDPQGIERPWPLDLVPLLIPADEWRQIEAGVAQRAQLLNGFLADLYGPQTLVRSGRLPASLIYADPGFRRPCHGLPVRENQYLHFYAVDLVRDCDGSWWVLGDRTNTPSGAGYALENRAVLGQVLSETYRYCQVERLNPFFNAFREALLALAPGRSQPRVVLLTPGPYTETYFEHAYIARHLGFTLVEGEDLAVRDRRVFLKTLSGLEPVDIILRRLDDDFCDPLELRADSSLGVAGLLQAVRAGTVVVANALGSGLMESMSFKSFLPSLCRHLLGEELKLPSVASWWCGQDGELAHVLDNLDRLVIKGANRDVVLDPIFGSDLTAARKERVKQAIRRRPWDFVGQERIVLSTAPVWQGSGLQAHHVVMRVYAAAVGGGRYQVMPGGLTRVAPEPGRLVVSMHSGGGSKDTWVLSAQRHHEILGSRQAPPRDLRAAAESRAFEMRGELRAVGGDLPSRVADGLFWLGRYAERCDGAVRLLRGCVTRLFDGSVPGASDELDPLLRLMVWNNLIPLDMSKPETSVRELMPALGAAILDPDHPASVRANVQRLYRAAHSVRDRLSRDMWRVITQIDRESQGSGTPREGAAMLQPLDELVTSFAALFGLEQESMARGPGWRFLTMGRRLERATQVVALMRGLRIADAARPVDGPQATSLSASLEVLLELGESFMTYRERYFASVQKGPVLQLLLADPDNPRALAFQLAILRDQLAALSESSRRSATVYNPTATALAIVSDAREALTQPDLVRNGALLRTTLDHLAANLPEVSNLLAHAFFSHAFARSA
ncbi:MAG: circularly permuted type 2 ATP-grasp protein [Rhodospirillaceae bacterium]